MPKIKFITKNGNVKFMKRREAVAMLEHVEAELVDKRPLTVRELRFPAYEEEMLSRRLRRPGSFPSF